MRMVRVSGTRPRKALTAAGATTLALSLTLGLTLDLTLGLTTATARAAPTGQTRGCQAPPLPPAGTPLEVAPSSLTAGTGTALRATAAQDRRLRQAVDNLVRCVNASTTLAATLFSPHFVRDFMGTNDYRNVPNILGGLRMDQVRVSNPLRYSGGGYSVDTDYLAYGHQVRHERTVLWPDPADGFWKVNGLQALPARDFPTRVTVDVAIGEYFFRPAPQQVCAPDGRLLLRLTNLGQERHELILLHPPPDATAAGLLTGTVPWSEAVTIAQDNGAPALPLIDVRPGTYTMADFIAAPDGVPHVLHGQESTLTVLACDG